jgi:hypothetical protein
MSEHMVSADRMIGGDYVIEEHANVVNWWAVILTLLPIAGIAALLAKRR